MSQIGFNAGGGCGVPDPCCIKEISVIEDEINIVLNNGVEYPITGEQVVEAYGDEVVTLIEEDVVTQLSLAVSQVSVDADGNPTFGLYLTYKGSNIGAPVPLEAHWDATGEPVALTFPSSLLPDLV